MGLYKGLRIDESAKGRRIGNWTLIGPTFSLAVEENRKHRFAVCQCDCGRQVLIKIHSARKHGKYCCFCRPDRSRGIIRKGRESENGVWRKMIQRCTDPSHKSYKYYGGRGIKVCGRWMQSFDEFWNDVGRRPGYGYQLDRINGDGDYEPGNCRWVPAAENLRNRAGGNGMDRRVIFDGELVYISEIAARLGLNKQSLYSRITSMGWSVEKAISTPFRKKIKILI